MDSEKFILDYNNLITRYKKANNFLTNDKIPKEQKEKWLYEYIKIIKQLGQMKYQYEKETGYKMDQDEEDNGFKI